MKKLIHKIKHWLGWYHGYCESFYRGKNLYMSYVCSECGKRSGVHLIDKLIK